MPIRITGMSSGLDTEALVTQLVSAYSTKKDTYTKAQTKLSWKQDAWKSLNTKVYSLFNKASNMRLSSAYNLKTATISDSTKAKVTASGSAVNGSYSLKVEQLARTGYLTGGDLAAGTSSSTTLAELGYGTGTGSISVISAGQTSNIDVDENTTISDFVSKLNEAGVKASYDSKNQRIFVAAQGSGESNDFSLTGSDELGVKALSKLGLNVSSKTATDTYNAWAAYAVMDGDGNYDSEATKLSIQSLMDQRDQAIADNETLSEQNTQLKASLAEDKALLAYGKAYAGMKEALSSLSDEQSKDFTELTQMSTADLDKKYEVDENGNLKRDDEGNLIVAAADDETAVKGKDYLETLKKDAGLVSVKYDEEGNEVKDEYGDPVMDESKYDEFIANQKRTVSYTKTEEGKAKAEGIQLHYENGDLDETLDAMQAQVDADQAVIDANAQTIADNEKFIEDNALIFTEDDAEAIERRIDYAVKVQSGEIQLEDSKNAVRVNGEDAIIYLNQAKFTSGDNTFNINGLTIEAYAETGDNEVSITTQTDVDGIYNKVKDFLKEYNTLMNEMTSLYNASSAKGYEPLTSDEKDAMTDTQVEEWEKKIKDALLRKDGTLNSIMATMKNSMAKSYTINGKSYSLASFGIQTLGVLNAPQNQESAYHIYGDSDDEYTSSKTDKLRAAIVEDPDTVTAFLQELTSGLYKELDSKMKSTSLSSAYTIYNDKQMAKEYSDYTTTIAKWEKKVSDMEDSYYKKFAAMESALSSLQSSTSALAGLLG